MGLIKHDQEEGEALLGSLEGTGILLSDFKEKELHCIAISSYYLLYR